MAADPGIPKPGKKFGPCKEACKHRDCDESRWIAGHCVCRLCGQVIGYERRFYVDPEKTDSTPSDRKWVHADCLEDEVDGVRRSALA